MATLELSTTAALLTAHRQEILAESTPALASAPHYAKLGEVETTARLDVLLDTLIDAVDRHDLTDVLAYARRLAAARFAAGYDLAEVQVAINTLEQAVWKCLFATAGGDELGESLALVSTALGAAKDSLAQTYVSLASGGAPVDVGALFAGTG